MGLLSVVKDWTGIQIGPNIQQTARDWCNSNLQPWYGTYADLTAKIAGDVNGCSGYVKNVAPSANLSDAQRACESCIKAYYQPDLNRLSAQQESVNMAVNSNLITGLGAQNNTVYIVLAIALIFLLFLLFI